MIGVLCTSSFAFAVAVEECEAKVKSTDPEVINTADYLECKTLEKLSEKRKIEISSRKEQLVVTSMNKKVQCSAKASFTYDFESCEHAINVYNYVLLAENAMNLQQQTRTEFNNQKLQAQAQERAAKGDFQVGALDVNEKAQKFSANLYKERVGAFSAAVTALVTAAGKIKTESDVKKLCATKTDLSEADCLKYSAGHKQTVLANAQAKQVLHLEAARYTAEVLRSVGEMNRSLANAKTTAQMKNNLNEMNDGQNNLDNCFTNPTHPQCVINRDRTAIDPVAGGGINFGGDGANNAFDFNSGLNDSLDDPEASTYNAQEVAAMGSPFSDEAKAAQGILDPAAAANVEFGSGGGVNGGGGGGSSGGGGLGGGSGAPSEEGDQVAKTSITGGDVEMEDGSAKGKGFSALSKGKQASANPFASLFDSKAGGGLEEDRSIASGDISGQASGLFQKISKRYGQVQADKRVETNNLE